MSRIMWRPFFVFSITQALFDCEPSGEVSFLQYGHQIKRMQNASEISPEAYYWSSRGGGPTTTSSVSYVAPSSFSGGPSWVWQNEFKEQVRHSPLIDADKNIYVCTTTRLRKFSPNGDILWTWDAPSRTSMSAAPALYDGYIYVLPCDQSTRIPTVVSIGMQSGTVKWKRTYDSLVHPGDGQALKVFNKTIFFGALTNEVPGGSEIGGTDTVVAASVKDGAELWQYVTDEVMWNFSPATPGDGSIIFSGSCGAAFRISSVGELIWKAGPSNPGHPMCTMAGGALGPNGIFYSEYSDSVISNNNTLAAYNATDGSLLWSKQLPYHALQYPAVGYLGANGPLVVAVPMGDTVAPPVPPILEAAKLTLMGALRNMVLVLDAATGETVWQSEDKPWNHVAGAGEMDEHNVTDGSMCLPDPQGIPVIAGDGTIYTSSSHHGDLRAIRDADGDGVISHSEVSVFKTGKCFLNSPSLAPGMLVAAPCWGPMYVFKD